MKITSNSLLATLATGLSVALGLGSAVSGVALWALMSQEVVHAGNCGGVCDDTDDCPGGQECYCNNVGNAPGTCVMAS